MELKQREELKKIYKPKNLDPTYLKNRRKFVEYLYHLGNNSKAGQIAIENAIALLDRLYQTQSCTSDIDTIYRDAIVCLTLAMKNVFQIDETYEPNLEHFDRSQRRVLNRREIEVFELLNFNTNVTTPSEFVAWYASKGVMFQDDFCEESDAMFLDLKSYETFVRKTKSITKMMTIGYESQEYRPSLIAAVIIAAARDASMIKRPWREELTALTGYDETVIGPILQRTYKQWLDLE